MFQRAKWEGGQRSDGKPGRKAEKDGKITFFCPRKSYTKPGAAVFAHASREELLDEKARKWQSLNAKRYGEKRKPLGHRSWEELATGWGQVKHRLSPRTAKD